MKRKMIFLVVILLTSPAGLQSCQKDQVLESGGDDEIAIEEVAEEPDLLEQNELVEMSDEEITSEEGTESDENDMGALIEKCNWLSGDWQGYLISFNSAENTAKNFTVTVERNPRLDTYAEWRYPLLLKGIPHTAGLDYNAKTYDECKTIILYSGYEDINDVEIEGFIDKDNAKMIIATKYYGTGGMQGYKTTVGNYTK